MIILITAKEGKPVRNSDKTQAVLHKSISTPVENNNNNNNNNMIDMNI